MNTTRAQSLPLDYGTYVGRARLFLLPGTPHVHHPDVIPEVDAILDVFGLAILLCETPRRTKPIDSAGHAGRGRVVVEASKYVLVTPARNEAQFIELTISNWDL